MIKIMLVGYGRMGKEIESLSREFTDYKIELICQKNQMQKLLPEDVRGIDVAIEFTNQYSVIGNIEKILSLRMPVVVGTSGWYSNLPIVEKLVKKHKVSLIYGQNFSIGANIFFNILEFSTKQFNNFPDYDVFGIETHHSKKKDSPSGTANKLAEIILKNSKTKKTLFSQRMDKKIRSSELHFASARGGFNKGRHEIDFDSRDDQVQLIHQAWSRRGFAYGALLAADYIVGQKGIFEFSEQFDSISKAHTKNGGFR